MHRITMWIAVAISAAGLVVCYLAYAGDTSKNPAVPTDPVTVFSVDRTASGTHAPTRSQVQPLGGVTGYELTSAP